MNLEEQCYLLSIHYSLRECNIYQNMGQARKGIIASAFKLTGDGLPRQLHDAENLLPGEVYFREEIHGI
jgi:hypothetical protein